MQEGRVLDPKRSGATSLRRLPGLPGLKMRDLDVPPFGTDDDCQQPPPVCGYERTRSTFINVGRASLKPSTAPPDQGRSLKRSSLNNDDGMGRLPAVKLELRPVRAKSMSTVKQIEDGQRHSKMELPPKNGSCSLQKHAARRQTRPSSVMGKRAKGQNRTHHSSTANRQPPTRGVTPPPAYQKVSGLLCGSRIIGKSHEYQANLGMLRQVYWMALQGSVQIEMVGKPLRRSP